MKVHLIGIGGTGMGALAGLLAEAGHEVRGSDGPLYPPMSTLLEQLGIPVFEGHRSTNLDWGPDRVVVGNICRRDHLEATAARERGMVLTSFPALLGELFLAHRHTIVVAGTHGKTTTSSMLACVLADREPGFLIGGIPRHQERSFATGRPPLFVVEGDEYDCAYFDKRPKFVHYHPRTVILTGVEYDHADIYPSLEAVERAFAQLVELVPEDGRMIVCADSECAVRLCRAARCPVETYSVSPDTAATWHATITHLDAGRQHLDVTYGGAPAGRFTTNLTGTHNASNALGVIAAAHGLGLDAKAIDHGLGRFKGVRRRQEVRGVIDGITVIDDFAHHPTAIRETLAGLKGAFGAGRLICAFEPRSATCRRRVFQHSLVEALAAADHVVISDLHAPEGIPLEERLDPSRVARDLAAAGTEVVHLGQAEAIAAHLARTCQPGDTVVVMSSGDFGGLVSRLLSMLQERA